MKRKTAPALALLTALALLSSSFSGCAAEPAQSTSAPPSTANSSEASTPPKGGITLTFASYLLAQTTGAQEAIQKMIDSYINQNDKGVTKVELINPGTDYAVYFQTQFMGGTQPDIGCDLAGNIQKYYSNGSVLNLKPYLASEKTPYVKDGSLTWGDSMSDNLLIQVQVANGDIPMAPYSIGANKLVYNPDLLAKYGVEPPATWDAFIKACKSIKDQGGEPIAYGVKDDLLHWPMRIFFDSLGEAELAKIDTDGSYFIDHAELCAAVDSDALDLTKEPWLSIFTLLDEFKDYWYPGATALDLTASVEKFAKGETAFMQCGIALLNTLMTNPERKFDPAIIRMPAVTTATSPFADGEYHNLGGLSNSNLWVSGALQGDKLAAAIDFMMFLTGEECAKILADEMLTIPVLSPAYMPPTEGAVGKFGLDYQISRIGLFDAAIGPEFKNAIFTDVQPMINGSITPQQAAAAQQKSLLTAVETIKADNGWTAENNYGRG